MSEPLSPAIAAVAAVMDEIDGCRNPMPCELCRQRMQSILDMGAAAERERFRRYARAMNDGTDDAALYDQALAAGAAAKRERIRKELALDQMADHAPIESIYGLTCRTCVRWQDAPLADGGETEFGIAIPAQWPCRVVQALDGEPS